MSDVIAAYVEGAVAADLGRPGEDLRKRVGAQAGRLLAEGKELPVLVTAGWNMGAAGWDDLARQVQRDAANARGPASANGKAKYAPGSSPSDPLPENYPQGVDI